MATQICFDITFEHPAYDNVLNNGVRDVVMSTAWVDEVPFLPGGWFGVLGVFLVPRLKLYSIVM